MSEHIISLENIQFAYPGGKPVLKDLDFTLREHEKIGLVAPNGSGKTTLFHLIMGLVKPQSGRISILDKEIQTDKDFQFVRKNVGFLFQDADDQLFSPTVLEDVCFGPLNLGKSKKDAVEISRDVLNYLGLEGFENRITFKLSGGEKKLVALATVLAMQPKALLLDEPSTGLDENTKKRLIDILVNLDLPYVLISHEADFLTASSGRIHNMKDGRIIMDSEVFFHSHEHAHPHVHPDFKGKQTKQ